LDVGVHYSYTQLINRLLHKKVLDKRTAWRNLNRFSTIICRIVDIAMDGDFVGERSSHNQVLVLYSVHYSVCKSNWTSSVHP
jgi:hypothetical protein